MRIVAGSAGGVTLESPKDADLRPTMDVVRGAIFSSLGDLVIGARVLDLFAGTGALAIEALSRGAARATLVERDPKALELIRKNLAKTRLAAEIVGAEVEPYLERFAPAEAFDLIFADPPYHRDFQAPDPAAELLAVPSLARCLAPQGIVILERAPRRELAVPEGWECYRRKKYGAAEVAYLRRTEITSP